MPFDPAKPANGSLIAATELRNQFTGLKDLIDAIPAPSAETDPVFAASEAALLGPGDKAKLDSAVQPTDGLVHLQNHLRVDGGTVLIGGAHAVDLVTADKGVKLGPPTGGAPQPGTIAFDAGLGKVVVFVAGAWQVVGP